MESNGIELSSVVLTRVECRDVSSGIGLHRIEPDMLSRAECRVEPDGIGQNRVGSNCIELNRTLPN